MFCPNCDRVYLKAKVCPHCGVKLLRATGKPEKELPPPSESHIKTSLSGRCPKCGSGNCIAYKDRMHLNYLTIKKCHPIYVVVTVAIRLLLLLKRGNKYYRCCDCGHKWRAKQ